MNRYKERQREIAEEHMRFQRDWHDAQRDMADLLADHQMNLHKLSRFPMTEQGRAIRAYIRQYRSNHDE